MIRLRLPAFVAPAVAAAALVTLPLVTRAQLLIEKDVSFGAFDVHGFVADLALGVLVATGVLLVARFTRVGAAVLGVAWMFLTFANYEHVHTFDAPVSATLAKYLLDPTFFRGSAMHAGHPVLVVFAMLAVTVPWIRRPTALPSRRAFRIVTGVGVALLIVAIAWPLRSRNGAWRQSHFLIVAARGQLESMAHAEPLGPPSAAVGKLFEADLSGQPRFPLPGKKRNVLVILLESFPAAAIPRLAAHQGLTSEASAPQLDAFGKRAVLFDNFIAQQRQTNRGEYSVLCGEVDRLTSNQARMTEYVQLGGTRKCLPQILHDAGYATAYLQAAPTAFMFKDQFMKQVGFERVLGTEFFNTSYARNRWGVDDRAFFEQAHGLIRDLNQGGKPWFATMLTVGTHHPYLVPGDYRAPGTPWARSVAYADMAVTALLKSLEDEGVLDDTVVLVSGDESNGTLQGDDLTRSVTQNWVPLLAFLPEQDARGSIVDEPFVQSDLALSLLDYLGLADQRAELSGRSIFRSYANARPLYFANVHTGRLWAVTPDHVLSGCDEQLDDCSSYKVDPVHLFSPDRDEIDWSRQRLSDWSAVVSRADTPLQRAAGDRTIVLAPPGAVKVEDRSRPGQVIFAGQYLDLPKDTVIEVEIEVEAKTDGLMSAAQDLWGEGKLFHGAALSLLGDGDRGRIRYAYRFGEPAHGVEVRLFSRPLQGTRHQLEIRTAKLVIHPPSAASGPVGVQRPEAVATHQPRPHPMEFTVPDFAHPRCVSGTAVLETKGCGNGFLVFGPYAFAPKGAHVRAHFELVAREGSGDYQAEIATALGKNRVPGTSAHVAKGGGASLDVDLTAKDPMELIEARLVARNQDPKTELTIVKATLEVVPAAAATTAADAAR